MMRVERVSFFDNGRYDGGVEKRNKYHARKVVIDGENYDSQKEAYRHGELKLLERAGEISNLRRQVKYELIPAQKIGGKVVERACTYIADYVYEQGGKTVVEDVKSPATRTEVYKIKKKLMLFVYGIQVREV